PPAALSRPASPTARRGLPRMAPSRSARRGGRLRGDPMLLRPFLNDSTSCASYLLGCTSRGKLAVVDPHAELVDDYLAAADAIGSPIVAVFETHVQADHVSGLPALVECAGATGVPPRRCGGRVQARAPRRRSNGATREYARDGDLDTGPCAGPPRVYGRRRAARHARALAGVQRRLAADWRRRSPGPARRR